MREQGRQRLRDLVVLVLHLAVMAVTSYMLYSDLTAEVRGGGELIGTITFKKKIAERKFSEQVVWSPVAQNAPIYNYDSIRTAEGSLAVVNLDDGTAIELEENTLIVLSRTKRGMDVAFGGGSINAQRGGGVGSLAIRSGERTINLQDASVNLSRSADGKSVDLAVKQGRAEVADGSGRTVVNENEKADLAKKQVEVRPITIVPVAPGYNARLPFGKPVSFAWRISGDGEAVLEVSASAAFASLEASRKSGSGGASVVLGAGTWYWRVVAAADRGQAGPVARFSIGEDDPVAGLSPGEGQVFQYRDRPPLVGFRWSESRSAAAYMLEVSRDAGIGSPRRVRSQTTGVSLDGLEDGTWYWRVAPLYAFSGEGGSPGAVRSFRIEKQAALTPPRPITPSSGERLSGLGGETVFSWRSGDYARYEVEISGLGLNQAAGAFFRTARALTPGEYQWRVRGVTTDGNRSEYSESISFSVVAAEPLRAQAPAAGASFAVGENVRFSWADPNRGKQYRLEAARDAGFSGLVVDETTGSRAVSRSGLPEGEYYWRVALLDEQGKRLAVSETLRFSILGAPAAPLAISPAAGETVEARERILFRWQAVSGAEEYRILFRDSGGRTLLERTVRGTEHAFTGVQDLESGGCTWEVRAVRAGKAGEATRTPFTLKAATITEKPVIISPTTIYID